MECMVRNNVLDPTTGGLRVEEAASACSPPLTLALPMRRIPFGAHFAEPLVAGSADGEKTKTQSPVWTSDGEKEGSGQMDWYSDDD